MSCCGKGTIKQKPSDALKKTKVKGNDIPQSNPTPTIPQSIKEQLIVNQQLAKLGEKYGKVPQGFSDNT